MRGTNFNEMRGTTKNFKSLNLYDKYTEFFNECIAKIGARTAQSNPTCIISKVMVSSNLCF